jgi:hypothetical protein
VGQIRERRRYFYVCQTAADIDCHQRRDVGDCESVPRDELVSVQFAIHPFQALMNDRALNFAVLRVLLETALKDRTGILNRASDGGEQFQLHPPVPPLNLCLFAEIAPQKIRL